MSISERIKERRKALGITQEQLAKMVGVSQNAIHKLEDGTTKKPRNILELAKVLGCQPDWLQSGKDEPVAPQKNVAPGPAITPVPLLDWVQAGAFCEAGQLTPLDEYTEFYPCPVNNAGPRTFALKVKGDSMTAPFPGMRTYPEGTIIFVDPDRTATPGQRVIARVGERSTFKQLMEDDFGDQYLKPLNDRHELIRPEDGYTSAG